MSADPSRAQPSPATEMPAEEKRRTRWGPVFWIAVLIVAFFILMKIHNEKVKVNIHAE